ncbi:transcriptional regulator [Yersinia sp. HM-2024]|uniref:winged helix-turn-helix domain-containing protein n=1 Tax=Yersinia sp. HM-2024 TaxID=3344550 RepID=UPI00370D1830
MTNNELTPTNVVLCEGVIFNSWKRTLTQQETVVVLSESESCLLKMLLDKTCSKREVMYAIWEKRGVIVTESSYYKLVRQLRCSFKKANLDETLIATLPRIGISYTGTKKALAIESTSVAPVKNKVVRQKGIIDAVITTCTLTIAATCSFFYMFTVG